MQSRHQANSLSTSAALFIHPLTPSKQLSMPTTTSVPPQPPAMSASTFLALPAEIRNQIYELALTSPKPLRIHQTPERAPPFNQLKYINKQLYAETAHLELIYNNLLVRAESYDEQPGQMLLQWLSNMPPAKRACVRTVTLKYNVAKSNMVATLNPFTGRTRYITTNTAPDFPETAETFRQLAKVCRANPAMKIHYQLPKWTFNGPDEPFMFREPFMFSHALQASFTFRDNIDFHHVFADFPSSVWPTPTLPVRIRASVVAWRKDVSVRDMQADNLRFFPTHTEEDQVKHKASSHSGLEHVRKWTQKWMLEGM